MFKKFFNWVSIPFKKIYNSRAFEFFMFAHDSVTTAVNWVDSTKSFLEMLSNVWFTLKIICKFIINNISDKYNNHKMKRANC